MANTKVIEGRMYNTILNGLAAAIVCSAVSLILGSALWAIGTFFGGFSYWYVCYAALALGAMGMAWVSFKAFTNIPVELRDILDAFARNPERALTTLEIKIEIKKAYGYAENSFMCIRDDDLMGALQMLADNLMVVGKRREMPSWRQQQINRYEYKLTDVELLSGFSGDNIVLNLGDLALSSPQYFKVLDNLNRALIFGSPVNKEGFIQVSFSPSPALHAYLTSPSEHHASMARGHIAAILRANGELTEGMEVLCTNERKGIQLAMAVAEAAA